MGSEEEQVLDVEETIFVAVGEDVMLSKMTLLWTVHNFPAKKICLLHVHQPTQVAAQIAAGGEVAENEQKQHVAHTYPKLDHSELHKILADYQLILSQFGVQANEVWIQADNVEQGIVDIIAAYDIKWLVMGAAADEYYTERLVELKSKKACFVCQQAALFCHIWFVCKGHLIYTRNRKSEIENSSSLLLLESVSGTGQPQHFSSESTDWLRYLDVEEGANEVEDISRKLDSQCSVSSCSNSAVGASSSIPLLTCEEWKDQDQALGGVVDGLKQAIEDKFEEAMNQWKVEEEVVEAKCKAKAFQNLYVKEISQRKEMEEMLATVKQEVKRIKDEHNELTKELQMVQDKKLMLESEMVESQCAAKELEEKIISAVELLISFRDKRDKLRSEHGNVVREIEKLKRLEKGEVTSFHRVELPLFSFLDIIEATNDFDPSWKFAEGKYGSIYKGILRNMQVAIRMLPYGSKSQVDFLREVEIICRVRHPNLATLVGICPESRSLVYEFLNNGSLEDRLVCKTNTAPLPWKIRTCIAADICSALIFLHSNQPRIIHGNVKPSNILLDANFASKLGDLGIVSLVNDLNNLTMISKNPDETSVYMDPEYIETGMLRPESDIFSFGIMLLRLLTFRPLQGLVKDVKCALENDNINTVLDSSAGDWPLDKAKQLANLALRCCDRNGLNRPDLASEVWRVLEPMKLSCIASASCSVSKKLQKTPSHFVCPIYQEVMEDPQIAADGFTYEAEAIKGWFQSGRDTSPMTNLKLQHCNLLPNYALHNAIQEWQLQL